MKYLSQKHNTNSRGTTLIELVVYIAIFSICMVTVLTTVLYMQKIFEKGITRYEHTIDMYTYIHTIQTYLLSAHRSGVSGDSIYMSIGNPEHVVTFKIVDGFLSLVTDHGIIYISNTKFNGASIISTAKREVGDTLGYESEFSISFTWQHLQKTYTVSDSVVSPNR